MERGNAYPIIINDDVSVPSVGSGLVEPPPHLPATSSPPVSVPSVGSGLVELNAHISHLVDSTVSVPSVGSGLVELIIRPDLMNTCVVSVPSVGSGLVEHDWQKRHVSFCYVSVPSVGSGLVEPTQMTLVAPSSLCFSTLCRVGFGGALVITGEDEQPRSFSTLCRVGFGGARRPLPASAPAPVSVPSVGSGLVEPKQASANNRDTQFQYPLSGRVWWSP